MRHLLLVAAALASSFAAHATIITYTTPSTTAPANGLTTSYAGTTTITFNGSLATPTGFSGGSVVKGNSSTQYAAPNGDTSNYYIVGGSPNYSGSATFTPGASYNYFGLYWGSIDAYNTITFLSNGSVVGTFTGSAFPPGNGSTTAANSNEFVDFLFSSGSTYNSVMLSTTSANFELDNVAYGNVTAATPEPSSLLLLGTGLLGAVGVMRRRLV